MNDKMSAVEAYAPMLVPYVQRYETYVNIPNQKRGQVGLCSDTISYSETHVLTVVIYDHFEMWERENIKVIHGGSIKLVTYCKTARGKNPTHIICYIMCYLRVGLNSSVL